MSLLIWLEAYEKVARTTHPHSSFLFLFYDLLPLPIFRMHMAPANSELLLPLPPNSEYPGPPTPRTLSSIFIFYNLHPPPPHSELFSGPSPRPPSPSPSHLLNGTALTMFQSNQALVSSPLVSCSQVLPQTVCVTIP